MICAPASSRSRWRIALTLPCVPTGMNAGVWTTPCGVRNSPRRAAPSEPWSAKLKAADTLLLGSIGAEGSMGAGGTAPSEPPEPSEPCEFVKKLRVGVIYGGRSGEHEVSVASAASIIRYLDRSRYEPVPIRIEKDGRWTLADKAPTAISAADVIEHVRLAAGGPARPGREANLVAHPGDDVIPAI